MGRLKKGSLPTYRLHKATGNAIVVIKGHTHYLGEFGSVDSRRRYAELISGSPVETAPARDEITVARLVELWSEWAHYYYRSSPNTIEAMSSAFGWLLKTHSDCPAGSISRKDLTSIRDAMIESGLARSGINKYIQQIQQLFRWAIQDDRDLVPDSTVASLALLKGLPKGRSKARETEPIKPVQVSDVLDTVKEMPGQSGTLIRIMLLTGCRPGEACSLRWEHIDRAKDVWRSDLTEHKTRHAGKSRSIHFGRQAQAILTPKDSGHVFLNGKGRPYSVRKMQELVGNAASRAGIEHWHPNQIRHTYATLVRARYGLEAAQAVLGHSSAKVTEIYAERDLTLAERVAREIG